MVTRVVISASGRIYWKREPGQKKQRSDHAPYDWTSPSAAWTVRSLYSDPAVHRQR